MTTNQPTNMKTDPTLCDCGHAAIPSDCTPGYAVNRATGKTLCYACADGEQRAALLDRSRPFVAYVSGDARTITTWTGGHLMPITRTLPCKLTRQSWTHDRQDYMSLRAVDCHGGHWHGRGSAGIAIRLRPCKA